MIKNTACQSFLTLISINFISQTVYAQTYQPTNRTPVADNTLGTQVLGNGNNFDITGGLTKGKTLFHSFTDFSVPTNGQANFLNPVGNRDIITRVTGGLFSDINGTLNSNGANFLLINPNGIVFGTNAQLNVGKAFVTSTANGINLVDGSGSQIVFGTNPNGDAPLLAINPNVLFSVSSLVMGGGNGQISNFGTLKTTNGSQYIGLIGGNVNLNGGKILAPGGRVDIGGLKTNGTVSINSGGLVFNGANLTRSDISITNGSSVSVRANQTLNPVDPVFFPNAISPGSSSINISANKIDLSNSGNRFIANQNNPINKDLGGLDAGLDVNLGSKTGKVGNIKLDATGDINIQRSAIFNLVRSGTQGTGGGIKITGNNITITNKSELSTNLSKDAAGSGGDIEINARGNVALSEPNYPDVLSTYPNDLPPLVPESLITASTWGSGNSGKVKIAAKGSVLVSDNNEIASTVGATGSGSSGGIKIDANSLILSNGSQISTTVDQSTTDLTGNVKNNAGNIDITTTGDITIRGQKTENLNGKGEDSNRLARIESNNFRKGDAGKITLTTPGKLSVVNRGLIVSSMKGKNGDGNSGGIKLDVGELLLSNLSAISSSLEISGENRKGRSGDIDIIATGNVTIDETLPSLIVTEFEGGKSAPSIISNSINGNGDGGKITITTPGKVTVGNHDMISSTVEQQGQGNPGGIKIKAGELEVYNEGQIISVAAQDYSNKNTGNAGDIEITTTGNITVAGNKDLNLKISPTVEKESGDMFYAKIASSSFRNSNTGKIKIKTGGTLSLLNRGGIVTECLNDCKSQTIGNNAGDITIDSKNLKLDRGDISLNANDNGGNIKITTQNDILMRHSGNIFTNSKGSGNGGNITIDSQLLIATNEDNNIAATAIKGRGGNVNINAQSIFGLKVRPNDPTTSDINVSSEFGRTGNVNIDTLGLDPGRDSAELPKTTTDASNQISQVCSDNNRRNKLTVAGRGGLPPTAYDPLTPDAIWQDTRTVNSQPAIARTPVAQLKLVPPAVGWVIGAQGKVTLIAAVTEGQPTGTRVICPTLSNR